MNPEQKPRKPEKRVDPLIAGAVVALVLAAVVGVAAVTGNLREYSGQKAPDAGRSAAGGSTAGGEARQSGSAGAPAAPAPSAPRAKARCPNCGVVVDVKEVKVKGEGTGVGVVAGGVAGAVLGHEVVGGRNQGLGTVAGALGGAAVGREVERHARSTTRYDVAVRMDDGSTKTVSSETQPAWKSGDRVRVAEGRIEPVR